MAWINKRSLILFFLVFTWPLCCLADLASETVYLTWQSQPETTMMIQWISETDNENDTIWYQAIEEQEWHQAVGFHWFFPDSHSQYFIHRIELTRLQPNTSYRFKLACSNQTYLFRTMPLTNDQPIRFVIGGDMYHDAIDFLKNTNKQAAKTNPHFAILGGDIAYSVGRLRSSAKVSKWIEWIQAWSADMVTPAGYSIPVVAAVGNHDVVGQFKQTPKQAKIFLDLFPRTTQLTYTTLDFGSYLSLFMLDSGHASSIHGQQLHWLETALKARKLNPHRFAIYHVPAYPSIRSYHNKYSKAIRRYWVPLFEETGIQLAFEHHDHAYKRTYPLLQNKVNSKGIIYLGDGAWGVEHPRRRRFNRKSFYIAKQEAVRHFMLVTLYPQHQHVLSISDCGQVIDELVNRIPIFPSLIKPIPQY